MLQALELQQTSLTAPNIRSHPKTKAGTVRLLGGSCSSRRWHLFRALQGLSVMCIRNAWPLSTGLSYSRQASYLLPDSNVATVARALSVATADSCHKYSLQLIAVGPFPLLEADADSSSKNPRDRAHGAYAPSCMMCWHRRFMLQGRTNPKLSSRPLESAINCLLAATGWRSAIPDVTLSRLKPLCFASSCSHDIVSDSTPVATPALGTLAD